jgi:probable F420-dependent oxidoreductase
VEVEQRMKVDTSLSNDGEMTASARTAQDRGYDGVWVGETNRDPFLLSLLAAQGTTDVTVGTSIAIAFARTPMTLAATAYDLARYSNGRFVLGLGSQVKAHIERRFSMPWSHPAPRMRELILAMRAIWANWQDGTPLAFEGEFYRHTLMTPFFTPEPVPSGPPPVFLAGVGEHMTKVAGEVADGFFCHAFTTERYIREVTRPALEAGRVAAGHQDLTGFTMCVPSFVTVGRTEEEMATAVTGTKKQIAFYASTPAYRGVLDLHGWGDVQPELTRLSKAGGWDEMGTLITDEMLEAFSVLGTPSEVAKQLHARYDGLIDRLSFYMPYDGARDALPEVLAAFKS